ncbi:MAG: hypothetical protein M1829_002128 [Trizodia sp. TS-e1964]|nr:MAG: hypothetical protein M1829_002128 [Trizodia sp. TS-e1964]
MPTRARKPSEKAREASSTKPKQAKKPGSRKAPNGRIPAKGLSVAAAVSLLEDTVEDDPVAKQNDRELRAADLLFQQLPPRPSERATPEPTGPILVELTTTFSDITITKTSMRGKKLSKGLQKALNASVKLCEVDSSEARFLQAMDELFKAWKCMR